MPFNNPRTTPTATPGRLTVFSASVSDVSEKVMRVRHSANDRFAHCTTGAGTVDGTLTLAVPTVVDRSSGSVGVW